MNKIQPIYVIMKIELQEFSLPKSFQKKSPFFIVYDLSNGVFVSTNNSLDSAQKKVEELMDKSYIYTKNNFTLNFYFGYPIFPEKEDIKKVSTTCFSDDPATLLFEEYSNMVNAQNGWPKLSLMLNAYVEKQLMATNLPLLDKDITDTYDN